MESAFTGVCDDPAACNRSLGRRAARGPPLQPGGRPLDGPRRFSDAPNTTTGFDPASAPAPLPATGTGSGRPALSGMMVSRPGGGGGDASPPDGMRSAPRNAWTAAAAAAASRGGRPRRRGRRHPAGGRAGPPLPCLCAVQRVRLIPRMLPNRRRLDLPLPHRLQEEVHLQVPGVGRARVRVCVRVCVHWKNVGAASGRSRSMHCCTTPTCSVVRDIVLQYDF
jgi:hypothetical protein